MGLGDLLKPRLTELGKIKIGGLGEVRRTQEGREWRLPRKDSFFTVTTLQRTDKGDLAVDRALMDELVAAYGDTDGKLRQLPIVVLSDDPEEILQASWCWYAGKRCYARSDGRTVVWFGDPKTMKAIKEPREE